MSKTENLSVDLIQLKLGTQMRAKVDEDTVSDYADLWKAKHEFPPLDVFHDGEQYILADGFHRLYGAKAAKRASVPCSIHKGDVREAILFACGANHEHGLHRSNADKRCAVESLLDDAEWSKRSARWIAEQCHVSNVFVSKLVADRKPSVLNSTVNVNSSKVESKDGKQRPAAKTKAAKAPQNASIESSAAKKDAVGPCPHGGEHDYDDEACRHCHDPKPADDDPITGDKLFKKCLEHIRLAMLVMEDLKKIHPSDKFESAFNSMDIANQDVCAWRRSAKR